MNAAAAQQAFLFWFVALLSFSIPGHSSHSSSTNTPWTTNSPWTTPQPSKSPTGAPTPQPTKAPTASPTPAPSLAPTSSPTLVPTTEPTLAPTVSPTLAPTLVPTLAPTRKATTITLDAYDYYGDGWNDNYINLYYVDPEESSSTLWDYTYAGSCCSDTYEQTDFDAVVGTCYLLRPNTSAGSLANESYYSLPECGIYGRNLTVDTYFCVDDAGRCSDAQDNWGASPLGGWPTADPNGTFVGGDNVTVLLECGAFDVVTVNLLLNSSGTNHFNSSSTQASAYTYTTEWEGLAAVAGGEGLAEAKCPLNRSTLELRFGLPWVNSSDGYYVQFVSVWYGKDGLSPSLWIESACLAGAGEYCLEDPASTVVPCNWNAENLDEWYYCPNGTYRAICPQGYYCNETNHVQPYICSSGEYCPHEGLQQKSICPLGLACPTGSYSFACNTGYYCPNEGMSSATISDQGYYVPASGNHSEQLECPEGYYCPDQGMGFDGYYCDAGTVCTGTGNTEATTCTAGYYCTGGSVQLECPEGYYCPDQGMSFDGYYCDAGTVCTGTGNTEATTCTAGYYCTGGSVELECEEGNYCPEGAGSMRNCSGTYPLLYVCPSTGMSEPYTCASETLNDADEYGNLLCYKKAAGVKVTTDCTYDETTFDDSDASNVVIDYICSCNPLNLYDGTYCETQQSLTTSKVFGAIALALSILLMVTCLACDGVWIVAGALDKRYVHPLVQRIRDSTVRQKQAAADREANELEDQSTSPAPSGMEAESKPKKSGGLWKRRGKKQGGEARTNAPAEPELRVTTTIYHAEQTNDAAIDAELQLEELKEADGQVASSQAEEIGQASESEEKETELSGEGIGSEHEADGESNNTKDANQIKGILSEHEADGESGNSDEVNRVKGGVAGDAAAELAAAARRLSAAAAAAAAEGGHGVGRIEAVVEGAVASGINNAEGIAETVISGPEAVAEGAVASAINNAEDIGENVSDPSAIQEFYIEYVKPIMDTLEPWRWFKCLLATFSILFGSACADIAKMIANVFLIVKGLTVAVPDFDTTRMDEIVEAFREFLTSINPDLSWLADVYDWFLDLCASFDIATLTMDSLQVTCEGSQAPSRLFANVLVVLLVVIIFETHLFPFVNISIQAASRLIRAFLQERKYPMLLVAVATNTARLLEFIFKYIVQLLQGVTAVSVFLPLHDRTVICADFDNQFRYIATSLFYVLMLVTGSVLLRTFVWGMPDGVKFRSAQGYLPNWFKVMFCYNETSHHKSDEFYSSKKGQLHHLTEEERDEVPSLADILVMIYVDAKNKNMETLKNYIKTMLWKIAMLLKMTFGIWDEALCKNMRIELMAKIYDDDPDDDEEYHQEMICLIGQSHCLVWQFAPALVSVSKFMEASHYAPVYTAQSVHVNNFLIDKEIPWWSGETIGQKLKSLFSKLKSFVKARFFIWFINVMKFVFVMLLALAPKATWIAVSSIISFPIYINGTIERLIELGFF